MKTGPRRALLIGQQVYWLAHLQLWVSHEFHAGQSGGVQTIQGVQREPAHVDVVRVDAGDAVSREWDAIRVQQVSVPRDPFNLSRRSVNAVALDVARLNIRRLWDFFRRSGLLPELCKSFRGGRSAPLLREKVI